MQQTPEAGQMPRWRRYVAAAGLFLLAPLVGEFLLGNLPVTFLWALIALAPLYGGGALLIREVSQRADLGWPGMLLLCLAFGVIEEGFVTQSLFNPGYLGLGLSTHAPIPWLGAGAWWTIFVLGLHTVWSTAVPIALVETLAGPPRDKPWLGRIGLGVALLLFAAGCAMTIMFEESGFVAAPHQFAVAGAIVAALVAAAFLLGRRTRPMPATDIAPPRPLLVTLASFFAGSLFIAAGYLRDIPSPWVSVAVMLLAFGLLGLTLLRWSARTGWAQSHILAVAAGLILTYVWFGFLQVPSFGGVDATTDLLGNAAFSAGALALLGWAAAKLRREAPDGPAVRSA